MKPNITFFGEKLPDEFDKLFAEDRNKVDLLIVMGSSLKVSPVADVKGKRGAIYSKRESYSNTI
jgi:NAD-dependent SIR2 family protein deacetylase